MAIPTRFDPLEDGPVNVSCPECRTIYCRPTLCRRTTDTGIMQQLYYCQGCLRGVVVRYDPADPLRHIKCQTVSAEDTDRARRTGKLKRW